MVPSCFTGFLAVRSHFHIELQALEGLHILGTIFFFPSCSLRPPVNHAGTTFLTAGQAAFMALHSWWVIELLEVHCNSLLRSACDACLWLCLCVELYLYVRLDYVGVYCLAVKLVSGFQPANCWPLVVLCRTQQVET